LVAEEIFDRTRNADWSRLWVQRWKPHFIFGVFQVADRIKDLAESRLDACLPESRGKQSSFLVLVTLKG
jgi:hypothetical protein